MFWLMDGSAEDTRPVQTPVDTCRQLETAGDSSSQRPAGGPDPDRVAPPAGGRPVGALRLQLLSACNPRMEASWRPLAELSSAVQKKR